MYGSHAVRSAVKIREFGRSRGKMTASKPRAAVSETHRGFLDELQEMKAGSSDLQAALAAVDEHGRRLRQCPTQQNLQRYKAVVRKFLQDTVGTLYEIKQDAFFDREGRRRAFITVKRVDQSLEELTRMFFAKEVSSLALAQRLDEIRGMLVDLLF